MPGPDSTAANRTPQRPFPHNPSHLPCCCTEIPPEWDADGERGISGNITIPKSYNELATLMSVTGAPQGAGRAGSCPRNAGRGGRPAMGPQSCCAYVTQLTDVPGRFGPHERVACMHLGPCRTRPPACALAASSACRGGRDPPPLLARNPPRVWLRSPYRHAHLLLPGGCLDGWEPALPVLLLAAAGCSHLCICTPCLPGPAVPSRPPWMPGFALCAHLCVRLCVCVCARALKRPAKLCVF